MSSPEVRTGIPNKEKSYFKMPFVVVIGRGYLLLLEDRMQALYPMGDRFSVMSIDFDNPQRSIFFEGNDPTIDEETRLPIKIDQVYSNFKFLSSGSITIQEFISKFKGKPNTASTSQPFDLALEAYNYLTTQENYRKWITYYEKNEETLEVEHQDAKSYYNLDKSDDRKSPSERIQNINVVRRIVNAGRALRKLCFID